MTFGATQGAEGTHLRTTRPLQARDPAERLGRHRREAVRKACSLIASMTFDAGLREAWPGSHGVPSVLRSMEDDVNLLENAPPSAGATTSSPPTSSGRRGWGGDRSADDGVERLYVVDSSVFPTNPGVNPPHSIVGGSRPSATRIARAGAKTGRSVTPRSAMGLDEPVTAA